MDATVLHKRIGWERGNSDGSISLDSHRTLPGDNAHHQRIKEYWVIDEWNFYQDVDLF